MEDDSDSLCCFCLTTLLGVTWTKLHLHSYQSQPRFIQKKRKWQKKTFSSPFFEVSSEKYSLSNILGGKFLFPGRICYGKKYLTFSSEKLILWKVTLRGTFFSLWWSFFLETRDIFQQFTKLSKSSSLPCKTSFISFNNIWKNLIF